MEYTLVCPNAIVVERKGLSISTYFTYDTVGQRAWKKSSLLYSRKREMIKS